MPLPSAFPRALQFLTLGSDSDSPRAGRTPIAEAFGHDSTLTFGDGGVGVIAGATAAAVPTAAPQTGATSDEREGAVSADRYHTEIAVTVVSFHRVDLSAIESEIAAATGEVPHSRRLPSVQERSGAVTWVVNVEWSGEHPAGRVLASTSLNLIYTVATCAVDVPCVIEASVTCYDRESPSQEPLLRVQKGLRFPTDTAE
jgi:hypothetical protein